MKRKTFVLCFIISTIFLCSCSQQNSLEEKKEISETSENNASDIVNLPQDTDTEQAVTVELTREEPAGDGDYYIALMGLQQYASFSGDTFTDQPKDDSEYLILYLKLGNFGDEPDYFNPQNFKAVLDGKEIKHTYLMNEPDEYTTAFTTIEERSGIYGYVVWEVPKQWGKLDITYTGWEHTNQVVIHSSFTSEDLFGPIDDSNGYLSDE